MDKSQRGLVKKAMRGNPRAFGTLTQQEQEYLYRMAFLYVRNEADALDVVQESILKAYKGLRSLREPEYFRTWLTRILIRKCQDILRRQGRCVPLEEVPEPAGEEPGHARAEFLALLDSLDEKYRTVLLLYYGEGFQTTEIARILDLKEETVKTRLKRARAGFRQIYEAE